MDLPEQGLQIPKYGQVKILANFSIDIELKSHKRTKGGRKKISPKIYFDHL